ncbi:8879_t:CDS:2 [Diversispora eburnea]|uniref:8879_t:CDS:1 n=1 Tax=Diversispora eburnea TaxID=1213867 RepID=A0A9N8YK88_9GLOM|nr:8879_t:CDS:2 [Diversispora eburnea]
MLIHNNQDDTLSQKKIFKIAVTIDTIYKEAILSFKWLEELSEHEEPLSEGLLFFAFDNKQREQKNYLD